jgi:hypothetical protein
MIKGKATALLSAVIIEFNKYIFYAESVLRPFLRRLLKTRFPPGLFMRARKPCLFLRFRLLG